MAKENISVLLGLGKLVVAESVGGIESPWPKGSSVVIKNEALTLKNWQKNRLEKILLNIGLS